MKRIGYWRQTERSGIDLPWPKEGRLPEETKKMIVDFLKNGKQYAAYRGWSTCRICNKPNGSTCLVNGDFIYPEGYAHYISEHNIQPDFDLLSVVLSQNG